MPTTTIAVDEEGRRGVVTSVDAEYVWAIFEEVRVDGTKALGEECHLKKHVRLVRQK